MSWVRVNRGLPLLTLVGWGGVANPGEGDEQMKIEIRQIYRDLDFFN